MAYATVTDVQNRMIAEMTDAERALCEVLLEDAAVLIDAYNESAAEDPKRVVSCNIVLRQLATTDGGAGIPAGATQGSMSGLGYSQSWTIGGGGSVGELYLSKTDKRLLGAGNKIGSKSPIEWEGWPCCMV